MLIPLLLSVASLAIAVVSLRGAFRDTDTMVRDEPEFIGLAQVVGAHSSRRTWKAVGGFALACGLTVVVVLIDLG
ncbi:hypothetical protein [Microbacterium telephonicum]|uniref:Uncharacterized protein n=1 Tax=Microbacterium telephonicum TaxID=1714841 RepID=A0A498BX17_9MICO|nr:hypothetical protein [Microbacterium telephonicum]RLK47985.1 hypothetical protein C7474_2587 [Microbacterium telephonicum]